MSAIVVVFDRGNSTAEGGYSWLCQDCPANGSPLSLARAASVANVHALLHGHTTEVWDDQLDSAPTGRTP